MLEARRFPQEILVEDCSFLSVHLCLAFVSQVRRLLGACLAASSAHLERVYIDRILPGGYEHNLL